MSAAIISIKKDFWGQQKKLRLFGNIKKDKWSIL